MRIFLFTVFLFSIGIAFSQQMNIQSFLATPNDKDALSAFVRYDQNGDKCAIIKIKTKQKGFYFEAGMTGIIKIQNKENEIWVYIPQKSKKLTIKHDQLGVIRNYLYPVRIEEANVYQIELSTMLDSLDNNSVAIEKVNILCDPAGALIYINNIKVGSAPLIFELTTGKHSITVKNGSNTFNDTIEIKPGDKNEFYFDVANEGYFTDSRDNKKYHWVKVGNQKWMSENLAYIPEKALSDNSFRGVWIYGKDHLINVIDYKESKEFQNSGCLYNYKSALESCPTGWHLPSTEEWEELYTHIITDQNENYFKEVSKLDLTYYLKTNSDWDENGNGNNFYKLNIYPGGSRFNDRFFTGYSKQGIFWTSSIINNAIAHSIGFYANDHKTHSLKKSKADGYSIRCIKD